MEQTGLITYPDMAIICPPERRDPANADTLLNPRVVVEILSPTTEEYDQWMKLEHYKCISSLTHIILVRQDQAQVDHYQRKASEDWLRTTCTTRASILRLADLGLDVPVAEIYDKLDLLEADEEAEQPQAR